jgi:ABC-2 type transport system ATP-binding protein
LLEVQGLTKRYGNKIAVDDVSFTVGKGEVFGLLGPNGAGKSTTIECALGIKKRDSGSVRLLGMEPGANRRALFKRVGVQFQQSAYQDRIRVWEACVLISSLHEKPLPYEALLKDFSLQDKERQMVGSLSGGERQKLSIILALLPDPEMVFLDELTTGLDPSARRDMWQYIQYLQKRGITVFLTTHYMEEAQHLCDRVCMLDHGRIVIQDTVPRVIDACGLTHVLSIKTDIRDKGLLSDMKGISDIQMEDGLIHFSMDRDEKLIDVIRQLDERHVNIEELNMKSPSLEDAYLHLVDGEEAAV